MQEGQHWKQMGGIEMQISKLMKQLGENREELLKQAVRCATPEELMELANENGIALSVKEAEQLMGLLHPRTGELSPDELDAITGGSEDEESSKGKCDECGGEIRFAGGGLQTVWQCTQCGKVGRS